MLSQYFSLAAAALFALSLSFASPSFAQNADGQPVNQDDPTLAADNERLGDANANGNLEAQVAAPAIPCTTCFNRVAPGTVDTTNTPLMRPQATAESAPAATKTGKTRK